MTDLERLLANGGPVPMQIPVVKTTTLAQASFSIEQRDDRTVLIFDVLLGQTAERLEIPFALESWDNFKKAVMAHGSGVTIASVKPA